MGVVLFGGMGGKFLAGHLPFAPRPPFLVGLFDGLLDTTPLILTAEILNSGLKPLEKVVKLGLTLPCTLLLDEVHVRQPPLALHARQLALHVGKPLRALDLLGGTGVFVAPHGLQDPVLEGPEPAVDGPDRQLACGTRVADEQRLNLGLVGEPDLRFDGLIPALQVLDVGGVPVQVVLVRLKPFLFLRWK